MHVPEGAVVRRINNSGTFSFESVIYMVDVRHAFEQVLVFAEADTIIVANTEGRSTH